MGRTRNLFSITVQVKNSIKRYGYRCYDEKNNRIYHALPTAKSEEDALKIINDRLKKGILIHPPKPVNIIEKAVDDESFKGYTQDFFLFDKCPFVRDRLIRGGHITKGLVQSYRGLLLNYVLPYFSQFMLNEITRRHINNWLLNLPSHGICNATANKALSVLRIILDFALFDGIIEKNPAREVKPLIQRDSSRKAFTKEQVKALYEYDYKNKTIVRAAIILAASTGLRLGEIRALRWADVRLNKIIVSHSFTATDGLKTTKSGKPREVPITPEVYEILSSLRKKKDTAYLFSRDGNTPVSSTYLNDHLKQVLQDLGIPADYTFHCFRHFFNTQLIEAQIPGEIIRAVIGHSDIKMTMHYAHVDGANLQSINNIQSQII